MRHKILLGLFISFGLFLCFYNISIAGPTESVELSVIPRVTYSVVIDTSGAAIDFGYMAPNEVKWTTGTGAPGNPSTATIRNDGTTTADWQIRMVPMTGTVWISTNHAPGNTKDTNGFNKICLTGILTPLTTSAAQINNNSFDSGYSDIIDGEFRNMGQNGDFAGGDGSTSGKNNGNNVAAGDGRILWLRMKSASDTSVTSQQKFRIEIRAMPSDTFE